MGLVLRHGMHACRVRAWMYTYTLTLITSAIWTARELTFLLACGPSIMNQKPSRSQKGLNSSQTWPAPRLSDGS